MQIIADTNALYSDLFLEGASVRTLRAAENQAGIRLLIPEVVVEELRHHVEDRLATITNKANSARRQFIELAGFDNTDVGFTVDSDQRQQILGRFDRRVHRLNEEGRILAYPDTSIRDLVNRSITVQLPFQDGDRGMRDTLIWLTTMEKVTKVSDAAQKITLVTSDTAFWDKKRQKIQHALTRELQEGGLADDAITVLPNFHEVIKKFVTSKLQPAQWVKVAIQGGQIDDFTVSSDTVLLKIDDWLSNHFEILDPGDYIFVQHDVVETAALQNITRTLDLGDGLALVDTEWTSEVVAEGYYNNFMGDNLRLRLRFTLVSVINVENDSFVVRSHEVGDVEIVDVVETQHDVLL